MFKLKEEPLEAIAYFLFVPLGAFVCRTGTANGLWELVASGCIMMIYGNLSIWAMIKDQDYRPPQTIKQ